MKFSLFGTSSGTPTKTRNVSGTAIGSALKKNWYLVDCGEGTQHRVLESQYSLNSLKAIFITHVHGDHCFGLPGLISSASLKGRDKDLTIVGPAELKEMLDTIFRISTVHLRFKLNFVDVASSHIVFEDDDFQVERFELSHRVPSFAYKFTESEKAPTLDREALSAHDIPPGPAWGDLKKGLQVALDDGSKINGKDYLIKPTSPRSVIVAGDNDDPSLLKNACDGASVLVHEATFLEELRVKSLDKQHSSPQQVARVAEETSLPNLVLTHMSPRYTDSHNKRMDISDLKVEAEKEYTGQLFLAKDMDIYTLNNDNRLAVTTKDRI